jgi:LPS O-antigen subunit length determinant protein (WzzB/FepE family)
MLKMNNNLQNNYDDEIDLKEIFIKLWHGKFYIFFCSVFIIFLASMHLRNAERQYLVEFKLKPVGETQQKNSFSSLSGFASIAGIQLPSNTTNDLKIFKELISSVEVSEIILKNENLVKNIYKDEWNTSLNNFSEPSKSKLMDSIDVLKRILTGNNEVNYMPPNARRLADYISKYILINESKDTGFLIIQAETSKPSMFLLLISEVIKTSDEIMRQRYINFSKEPLAFYKEKLRTSRSREHREALAELIAKEEQKLMFASRGKYFTVEPYIDPVISLYPTSPKPKQYLVLSLIFGLFLGSALVFMRHAIKKEN